MLFLVLNFVKAAVLTDQNGIPQNSVKQTLSLDFEVNPEDKLCDRNDIYILDGERTLVITSRKLDQKAQCGILSIFPTARFLVNFEDVRYGFWMNFCNFSELQTSKIKTYSF